MSEQTTVREGIAKQIMLSYFPELRNDQPKNMIKVYGRDQSAIGFYITKIAGAPNRAGRPLYRVRQGEIGGTTDIPITDPENYRRVLM
ncbi:MAG TPA: hypothetical protein VJH34_01765 [archaeon]|nr:hypothetical protein [archaeon]